MSVSPGGTTPITVVSITPLAVQRDTRTYKIAASLARAGHRSIVVELETSAPPSEPWPFELRSLGRPSAALPVGTAGVAAPGRLERLRRAVQAFPPAYEVARAIRFAYRFNLPLLSALPPADLYYLHAPYQFPAVQLAARRHGAAVVYDAHDFYTVLDEHPSAVARWIETWCVREAAGVVTVSDGVAELIAAEFGRRPAVIRNSQDDRLEGAPPRSLREVLGLPADAFIVVSTGNRTAGWRTAEVIAAIGMLPDHVHLALVGTGYDADVEVVRRAGLEHRVHVVPPVPPSHVVPFIRSADAFIIAYVGQHASYQHSLPNKFFHAIAAELPVIYPALPEMERLAAQYGIGVAIDPTSPTSIRDAIRQALDDSTRSPASIERRQIAHRELGWEREEQRVFEVIREALAAATLHPLGH